MLSCGEQKKQREVEWSSVEVEESQNTSFTQDAIKTESMSSEDAKPMKMSVPSSRAASSSSRSYDDNDDNLRGWDPASEDDMDDNGIRRYMENNDEEGWDQCRRIAVDDINARAYWAYREELAAYDDYIASLDMAGDK